MPTGTTSSGISGQLREIYSICRCRWNVAKYKWKKTMFTYSNDIISFLSTSLNIYNKTCKLGVEKIAGYTRGGDRWLYGMHEIYYTTSGRNVNIMFTYTRSLDSLLFSVHRLKRHQLYQKIKS